MKPQIITTGDGSHSLYVPELSEHYHSTFGAIRESRHVFIQSGLEYIIKNHKKIKLLEIGFGTGLNVLLTCLHASGCTIDYTGIEAYPLNLDIAKRLNYCTLLEETTACEKFKKIILSKWEEKSVITNNLFLTKHKAFLQNLNLENEQFHLIYFDAFAPDVQPELWTLEIFSKLFHAIVSGGVLVTYSSKGLVKQNLRGAGFTIERIAGPPGKRHILRATKV